MNIDTSVQPRVDLLDFSRANSTQNKNSTSKAKCYVPGITPEDLERVAAAADKRLEEIAKTRPLTMGLMGQGEYDLYFVPSGVLDNALNVPGVGEKAPNWSTEYSNTAKCWNEFYSVLGEYGINHNDPQSMQEFFANKTLFDEVNSVYEERMSKLL